MEQISFVRSRRNSASLNLIVRRQKLLRHSNLAFAAATLEICVPIIVALCYWRLPRFRRNFAVVLGALTPFFVTYSVICAFYPFRDKTNPWGEAPLHAAQQMSILPYIATIGVGIGLSFLSGPPNLLGRYFFGLLAAPIAFIVLAIIGTIFATV